MYYITAYVITAVDNSLVIFERHKLVQDYLCETFLISADVGLMI